MKADGCILSETTGKEQHMSFITDGKGVPLDDPPIRKETSGFMVPL